jgi:hypothetical protein
MALGDEVETSKDEVPINDDTSKVCPSTDELVVEVKSLTTMLLSQTTCLSVLPVRGKRIRISQRLR